MWWVSEARPWCRVCGPGGIAGVIARASVGCEGAARGLFGPQKRVLVAMMDVAVMDGVC